MEDSMKINGEMCGAIVTVVVGAVVGGFIAMGVLVYDAHNAAQVETTRIVVAAGMEQHQRVGDRGWLWAYPIK